MNRDLSNKQFDDLLDYLINRQAEANKYIKKSVGFSSYDWMIDSILECGQILNTNERNEILKNIGGKNEPKKI